MRQLIIAALTCVITAFGAAAAMAAGGDLKGSADYPGIGRFAGSVITGYDVKSFDETKIQAGAVKSGKPADERKLEGRVTRIAYRTAAGPSIAEVYRNFENQLTAGGYKTLYKCETDECGGAAFSEALDVLPIPMMWVDGFNFRYLAVQKSGGEGKGETFVQLIVSENNQEIYAQVNVIEVGALANKMVDAAKMAKGISETGHIALYGIYFDSDKADIKPESSPTLDEISKLLKSQPALKVYIVGHTDSQGGYDYNMSLSKRRAEAVVAALVKTYAVSASRLTAAGVGFLAPLGPNATEAGRALNRRVELVSP